MTNSQHKSMTRPETLLIASITLDDEIQPRQQLDETVVAEYSEAMKCGAVFPPVIVYYDGSKFWLADGFHRVCANQKNNAQEILAEVKPGTRREACLYAVGANAAHGLRRTNADKRRSVERLLRDDEWSQWSNREIARRCGVDHVTVGNVRRELFYAADFPGEIHQRQKRLLRRNGKVQNMDISNIGCKSAKNTIKNFIEDDVPSNSTDSFAFPDINTQSAQQESEDNLGSSEKAPTTNGHIHQIATTNTTRNQSQISISQETLHSLPFCIVHARFDPPEITNKLLRVNAQFVIQGPINALPTIMNQMQAHPGFAKIVLHQAQHLSQKSAS